MATTTSQRRFRPRFRLRTFLIVVTVFCVWLGWHIHGARRQREVVAAIVDHGGEVTYGYSMVDGEWDSTAESKGHPFCGGCWGTTFSIRWSR